MASSPTYSDPERLISREDFEGCADLIAWYGDKYPGLRAQWNERRMRYLQQCLEGKSAL